MDLYKEMLAHGATEAQLNSKTFGKVEDILIQGVEDAEGVHLEAGRSVINRYIVELNRAETRARLAIDNLNKALSDVREKSNDMRDELQEAQALISEDMLKKMRFIEAFYSDALPSSPTEREAIKLFRLVLQSVKDIYGDDVIHTDVVCSAIEAASYGMWRSIMGPKEKERDSRFSGRVI